MKILHTADWHLGDRLGRIDRTDDLRRAVERVADYCARRQVDVLLVAGDLFSELARPDSLREAIRHLQEAYPAALARIREHPRFDRALPTVLSAHVHVRGGEVSTLFRISEQEDVVFESDDLPADFAYVALGHIHKPQCIGGHKHVRYSGSIERMDLGESGDNKGVVLFEVGPEGRRGEP